MRVIIILIKILPIGVFFCIKQKTSRMCRRLFFRNEISAPRNLAFKISHILKCHFTRAITQTVTNSTNARAVPRTART
jgi:hypothetical protein